MIELNNLKNASRGNAKVQRKGRGPGSGRGKTSCRGQKGAGARSGSKRRYGYEGGQMRLFCKLPHRGFTRGRFIKEHVIMNLCDIDKFFNDGDTVNLASLYEKGLVPKEVLGGLKILGVGDITKKDLIIEARGFSESAKAKLDSNKISYKVV